MRKIKLSKSRIAILSSFIIAGLLLLNFVYAIPNSLTLQGKLTNQNGVAQSGTYNFSFKIYDSFTGGNVLYTKRDTNVTTDVNGIYDIILNNLSNLNFSDQYYLGITVGTDNESTPRVNLTNAPYSFRANTSESLNPENKYRVAELNVTDTLSVNQTFFVTGNKVGIGTAFPSNILTIIGDINITGSINISSNITFASLRNCDTIDTDANGLLTCGNDDNSVDASAFKVGNVTLYLQDNASIIRIGNLTDIFLRNYSNEYARSGFKLENASNKTAIWNLSNVIFENIFARFFINATQINSTNISTVNLTVTSLTNCDSIDTDDNGMLICGSDATTAAEDSTQFWENENNTLFFGNGGNASVLKTENITKDLAKFFSNFGLANVSNESTGNVTAINQLLNDAGFTSFNIGNVSNNTLVKGDNTTLSLWNLSGINIFLRELMGNVGIGTFKPDTTLTILGNEITANAILHINASDSFNTSVVNVLTLDHVLKNPLNSTGGVGVSILFRGSDNASQLYKIANISAILYNSTNGSQLGALTFSTSIPDIGDESFGHLRERLRIDGHGRVGINNTAPNETLDVKGTLNIVSGSGVQGLYQGPTGSVGIGTLSPNTKLEVNGTSTFNGDINAPNSDINVGGGYSAGGVTLVGQGANKGSGQFGRDILLDGNIVAVYDVEINQSFVPVKDLFSLLGNVTQRFLDLFIANIKAGNRTLNITGNVSVGENTLFVDNSSRKVGIGTTSPISTLTVIGDASTFGSLNATFFNATEIRQGQNQVQTINAVFNLANYSAEYASTGFKLENASNKTAIWNLSNVIFGNIFSKYFINATQINSTNISTVNLTVTSLTNCDSVDTDDNGMLICGSDATTAAEDSTQFWENENNTLFFGNGGNASVLKTENITKDLAKFFSNFGLANVSNESTGNVTAINQLLNDAGFTSFNIGNVSNNTIGLFNASISLWNISGSNIFLREITGNVGIGNASPDNRLTISGNDIDTSLENAGLLHLIIKDNNNKSVTNFITLDHDLVNEVNSTGGIGLGILLRAVSNDSRMVNVSFINASLVNPYNLSEASALSFYTRSANSGLVPRLILNGSDVVIAPENAGDTYINPDGGFVGIGTSSPLFPLTVVGTVNATRLNGTLDCTMIGGGSDGDFCADATGTGEDSAQYWNRGNTTDYIGGDNASLLRTGNFTPLLFNNSRIANLSNNSLTRYDNETISLWNKTGTNFYLRDNAGNIGLGTINPSNKIDIVGVSGSVAMLVKTDSTNDNALYLAERQNAGGITGMRLLTDSTTKWTVGMRGDGGSSFYIYEDPLLAIRLAINATNGNVGIGNYSNPQNKLTVAGDDADSYSEIPGLLYLRFNDTSNTSTSNIMTLDHLLKNPENASVKGGVDGGIGVGILFRAMNNNSEIINVSFINASLVNARNGTEASALTFYTINKSLNQDTATLIPRLILNGSDVVIAPENAGDTYINPDGGFVGIGTTNPINSLTIAGDVSTFGSLNATFINATNIKAGLINVTKNITMSNENNSIFLAPDTNRRIYANETCVVIEGPTAVFAVC